MAESQQGKEQSGGGEAVGGVTPPPEQTMKFAASELEKTMQQAPPPGVQQTPAPVSSAPLKTMVQQQNTIPAVPNTMAAKPTSKAPSQPPTGSTPPSLGKSRGGHSGDYAGTENIHIAVEIQDLSGERLLMAAPRKEAYGQQCPALNDIPLLAKLGQGGMGAVYYGIHPRLRSEVAVKVLPFHLAEQDPGMIRRFFREAQIAAQVRSPHLCNVMDVNEEAGLFFLVMEYVTGQTAGHYLKALLEKTNQGMPEKDVLDVTIAATEGLWAAHAQGVVHRDIKPENIMIPYAGRGSKEYDLPRAKMMDLGLARSEESQQSLTGAQSAMGTPGYMAPEQAMDAKSADKRSDVFSMGATIYCLLFGKSPFRGETIMKVLMATMHEPHEPIIKVRPDVSPALNEIIEKCLNKKQDARFSDAKQLLTALEDCRRLLGGGVGAGAFSAAFSAAHPMSFQGSPTPTPTAGGQQTIVGPQGAPGSTPPIPAPQKSKGMLYVGAGVAAMLLAGVGFMVFRSKPNVGPGTDDGKGAVIKGGTPGTKVEPGTKVAGSDLLPQKIIQYTPDLRKIAENKHIAHLKAAETSLKEGDLESAAFSLGMANDLGLGDNPESRKKELEVAQRIDAIKKERKFDEDAKSLEKLITNRNYKGAADAIIALMAEAPDAPRKKKAEEYDAKITAGRKAEQVEESARKIIDQAAKATADTADVFLPKLAKLRESFPAETDPIRIAVVEQEKRLTALLGDKQKNDEYDKLIKDTKAAEQANKWKDANDLASKALALLPARPEAAAEIKLIQDKLSDQDARAFKEKQEKEYGEAIVAANAAFNQGNFPAAAEAVSRAVARKPNDEAALAIQKRIDAASAADKEQAALKRKQDDFKKLSDEATQAFKDNDLPVASEKIKAMALLFPQDPAVAKHQDELKTRQQAVAQKTEFTQLVTNIREKMRLKNVEESEELFGKLQKHPAAEPAVVAKVKENLDDLKKETEAMKSNEAAYSTALAAGKNFESAGDGKTAPSDKRSSYEQALAQYTQAQNIKKGGEADAAIAKLQPKIASAKTEEAALAKRKADEEAALKAKRQQFDDKLGAAETAVANASFKAAYDALVAARKLIADDPKLPPVEKKYKDALTAAEAKVMASVDAAAKSLSQKQYDAAVTSLKDGLAAYTDRADLSAVITEIGKLKTLVAGVESAAVDASRKFDDIKAKAGAKGADEAARATAAIASLRGLCDAALADIATKKFEGMAAIVSKLQDSFGTQTAAVTRALSDYDQKARSASSGTTSVGDNDPTREERRPPKERPREDPKPPKRNATNVGDGAPE
ncbi:MAG TPA: protein kinase [Planctomycetota bacterium]|jgi:serine/threonine protein kinase